MRSLILNFLLLVFGISLNLNLDAGQKQDRFCKILLEKGFKLVPSRESNTVAFDLGLILLLVEIDLISEEQIHRKHVLKACGISHVKIIFALSTKVVIFYMGISVIQIVIPALKSSIPRSKVC